MVRYWDASALLPLLIGEITSGATEQEHARDPEITTWWGTTVECDSALARREREGVMVLHGRDRLALLSASWSEVPPTADVRRIARRLVRVHPLRGADALQLSAAITAADGNPEQLPFVTLDARLADAADREGFRVVRPSTQPRFGG
jgi:predicted nucleic acid-binding protein